MMIAVINYGAGNLGSVVNALARLGREPVVTGSVPDVLKADAVFLPGVGAAGDTMKGLQAAGMDSVVTKLVELGRPLFAICVGLQVLLTDTEEGGRHKCLDIIPGRVRKLQGALKVPHMGWNQVRQLKTHPIFDGIPDNSNFYFVHSYYADPEDGAVIAATTDYGTQFCSMVARDSLIATQFHPEKSGEYGLRMYSNFLDLAGV
jgi:glutamine amidotransferase